MQRNAACLICGLFLLTLGATARADDGPPAAADGASQFDDPLTPLTPKVARSEAEEDRVTASALFAQGRLLFQRQDYDGALRCYQRAWRTDPQAIPVLREIVPLAFQMRRHAEAARYAVIAAQRDPRDPVLLKRLAIHLTEQEDYELALQLYESALELTEDEEPAAESVFVHLEMGRLQFITENFAESAKHFAVVRDALADPERFGLDDERKQAILDKPDRTYALLGESFFQAGRLMDAVEMFQQSHQAKPNEPLLALQLARVEAKQDQNDKALEHVETYLAAKESTAGVEPYQLFEQLLEKKHGKERAAEIADQRLAKLQADDPANQVLGYYVANRYRDRGELNKAAAIYDELLKLQPALDGYQGLVDVYRREKDVEKLLDAIGQAVLQTGTLDPLGEPAEEVAKDKELVGKLISVAKTRAEDEADEWADGVIYGAALVAIAAERFDDADTLFALALQSDKPDQRQIMLTWGLEMLMADQFNRAARVFQRAVDEKVSPEDDAEFYFYLSGALELDGQTDEALAVAEKAAAAKPDSSRFQSRVPWILYHARRYDEAEKSYISLIEKYDQDRSSDEARETVREARMILSNISVQQKRIDDAVEWLEKVLDEFPEDIGAMNDLGYLWADEGKHLHRALAMVRKAVEAEPDNIAYRDSLGWALYRLGRFEAAVQELEQAAAGDDPDGIILDHLGDAYFNAGQREQAIATWQRAAAAMEKQEESEKAAEIKAKVEAHSVE